MKYRDERTGQEYIDRDWGHGTDCRCLDCVNKHCSDLVEAGILELVGFTNEAEPLLVLKKEYKDV